MDNKRLTQIFYKTDGNCHLCYSSLTFSNYGKYGARGAWHVEHSIPRANGGSDHLNNLYPACIDCNLKKGTQSTRTFRVRNGSTRAPYNREKKTELREQRTVGGALTGAGIGLLAGGPIGAILCGILGAIIGENSSPKK